MARRYLMIDIVLLLASLAACGKDDPAQQAWAGTCARDLELVQLAASCMEDGDCPCGSHCELGVCQASCTWNDACNNGQVCDNFGRCTHPGAAGAPNPISGENLGILVVDRLQLDLPDAAAVSLFRLSSRAHDLREVRIAARGGLEVSCGNGFGSECRIKPLAVADGPQPIAVRYGGEWPEHDVRVDVNVYAPGQQHVVGVLLAAAPPPEPTVRHGVYAGTARLVGAGLQGRTEVGTLPAALSGLELSIAAHVFPEQDGYYEVAFFDERRAVFAKGAMGLLSVLAGTSEWEMVMPGRPYLGPDNGGAADHELDVHVSGVMQAPDFRDGRFFGDLVASFEGIAPLGKEPFVRWEINLLRTGALADGAERPSLAPNGVAELKARARAPFPEEVVADAQHAVLTDTSGYQRAVAAYCSHSEVLVDSFADVTNSLGDLLCTQAAAQRAFGIESGKLSDQGPFIHDCEWALDSTATLEVGDASQPGRCADRVRAVTAVAAALTADRERALEDTGSPDTTASRLGHRALQQWLAVMTVAASGPRRIFEMGPLLPGDTGLYFGGYHELGRVRQAAQHSIDGWNLFLHPRIGAALVAMPPAVLHSPDYRPAFAAGPFEEGEQELGLPVSMLLALSRQLETMEGFVEDLAYGRTSSDDGDALLETLSRFLPRNVVVFALAKGLRDAARSQGTPSWDERWLQACNAYGATVARLVRNIFLLEAGANPLGITNDDLPLYRLGDQQGTTARFSALSDALLGTGQSLAIAPTLIGRAADAELLARNSVVQLLDRELAHNLQQAATQARVESLHRRYGERITSLCGDFNSLTVLEHADEIDPSMCFIDAHCRFDPTDYLDRFSLADLGYQICLTAKLRERFGNAVSTGDVELNRELDATASEFNPNTPFFSIQFADSILQGFVQAYQGVNPPSVRLPDGLDPAAVRAVESLCESARQHTLAERPNTLPASCDNTDACPVGYTCDIDTSTCVPENKALDPSCYRGSLGEAAIAVHTAATAVEVARAEMESLSARYDNAMRGCIILQQGHRVTQNAIANHHSTMSQLDDAKFAADTVAATANKVRGVFLFLDNPFRAIGAAVAAGVEQAAESTANTIELRMNDAERAHALTLTQLEHTTALRRCLNEAEMELVGTRSAALRVRQQTQDLGRTLVAFNNLTRDLVATISEGLASIDNEVGRHIIPAHVDHWLDQNLDRFTARMRRARRALYLAVLAVEYEYQFSSRERQVVLAARTPAELEDAMNRLRDVALRGAPPQAGNPTQLLSVVSLRRNLLQLADRAQMPPGWHALSDITRFRQLLLSPRFAALDEHGTYLGQEIPFAIQPVGAIGLGETGAVPLLSGLSCAERLWSVNASIHGENLMHDTDSSIATLQIRQRNTFGSQYCNAPSNQNVLRLASTRPSQNLFIDPMSAGTWHDDDVVSFLTNTQQISEFAWGTVQARVNTERKVLESGSYTDGESFALAGRGVFADYMLFIPATAMSIDGSAGLSIENIDDILIRLEYVAAERQ